MEQRRVELSITDIPQVVDVVCIGLPGGWVDISANERGRKAVEAVFPDARIAWRDPGEGFPAGWRGFALNLPKVADHTRHRLPPINNVPLDGARPDALALVLVIAAKNQGARSGLLTEEGLEIFHPRTTA